MTQTQLLGDGDLIVITVGILWRVIGAVWEEQQFLKLVAVWTRLEEVVKILRLIISLEVSIKLLESMPEIVGRDRITQFMPMMVQP